MAISLSFTLLITAPGFGSQGAYSAYQFCVAALAKGQVIKQIFFYGAGAYNANQLIATGTDERNLVVLWQQLARQYAIKLHVCVAAAQQRGIIDNQENSHGNLAECFALTGLSELITAINSCERFIAFN